MQSSEVLSHTCYLLEAKEGFLGPGRESGCHHVAADSQVWSSGELQAGQAHCSGWRMAWPSTCRTSARKLWPSVDWQGDAVLAPCTFPKDTSHPLNGDTIYSWIQQPWNLPWKPIFVQELCSRTKDPLFTVTAWRTENKQRTKSNQVALDINHPASRQKTTSKQERQLLREKLFWQAQYPTAAKPLAFLSEATKTSPPEKIGLDGGLIWSRLAILIFYIFTVKKRKKKRKKKSFESFWQWREP